MGSTEEKHQSLVTEEHSGYCGGAGKIALKRADPPRATDVKMRIEGKSRGDFEIVYDGEARVIDRVENLILVFVEKLSHALKVLGAHLLRSNGFTSHPAQKFLAAASPSLWWFDSRHSTKIPFDVTNNAGLKLEA